MGHVRVAEMTPEQQRAYREQNRLAQRAWRAANPERNREAQRRWREAHRELARQRVRASAARRRAAERAEALAAGWTPMSPQERGRLGAQARRRVA